MKNKIKKVLFLVAGGFMLASATPLFATETIYVYDSDSNGSEVVSLSGANSIDPDGAIVDFTWRVNNIIVLQGFGPTVSTLTHTFALGNSTASLTVRDDTLVSVSTSVWVRVLPASANLPPLADAIVPGSVEANALGLATVTVNASISSDPEGDPIIRYVWTEGTTTYYDGPSPTTAFQLTGVGLHTIRLRVFSRDSLNIVQSGFKDFNVDVQAFSQKLAGRKFTRIIGQDFSFSGTYGDPAGLTYNALTQTYFISENKLDKIFEIDSNGALLRTIDTAGLRAPGEIEADLEGMTWMYGTTYALVSEGAEEMLIVQIVSTTTALTRANAGIHDLFGDPKGIAYRASEDALYFVSEDTPKRLVKSRLNPVSGQLDILLNLDVDNLPASALGDVAFFPRLSPHPLIISHSSRTIMEVDITGGNAVVLSSFSLTGWDIPEGSALAFGANGNMTVVCKNVANTPEDSFNVFAPTSTIPNIQPTARIEGILGWLDSDGDGEQYVTLSGLSSFDPDGGILRYEWIVDGVKAAEGAGPRVGDLKRVFPVGTSAVSLIVYDSDNEINQATVQINVKPRPAAPVIAAVY